MRFPVLRRKKPQKKAKSKKQPVFANDKTLGIVIAALLLIGIAAITAINIATREPPAPYSTLGFTSPDDLPNLVRMGNTYNATYQVKSKEHQPQDYTITTTYELFRLYDVTEGLYSCLGPYRRKVYLKWTNETNTTHQTTPRTTPIQDMVIPPSKDSPINWSDQHTLSFILGKGLGNGTFTIYYEDHYTNETRYQIDIRTSDGMVFFNGRQETNITLARQNDRAKVRYKDQQLSFIFNGETVFTEFVEFRMGQFGFETRDVFMSLQQMHIQHVDDIDVPDKENIWDYIIDLNQYYRVTGEVQNSITRTVQLQRDYDDFAPPEETVKRLITYTLAPTNTTDDEVSTQAVENITAYLMDNARQVDRTSFWLRGRDENASRIPWDDAIINVTFERPEPYATHTILIGTQAAVQLTNETLALITVDDGTATVQRQPYRYNESKKEERITILANTDITVEGLTAPLPTSPLNQTISTYQENSFKQILAIRATRNTPACLQEQHYDLCYVQLQPNINRQAAQPPIGSYADVTVRRPTQSTTPEEGIASQTASFDGILARITNQTNYSMELSLIYLDGAGLLDIGLVEGENSIFTLIVDFLDRTLTYNAQNTTITRAINMTSMDDWVPIKVDVKDDTDLSITINRTLALNTTISRTAENNSRHFTKTENNTYFETRQITLQKDRTRTNVPLLRDPCQLRTIHQETLREESFTLQPEQNRTFTDEFTIGEFFDYGKVAVDVRGSSGMNDTPLHIHAWLVRE